MKIGIIGAGNVGGTLGRIWASKGHQIKYGVRNAQTPAVLKLVSGSHGASADTVPAAAAFGEVVVLATPWQATQDAIKTAGDLKGKIVVDCVNPLKSDLSGLDLGHTTSAAEEIAGWARGARVIKAFNTIGAVNFAKPVFGRQRATMFICGDHEPAKTVVSKLAEDIGFEPVDAGPLTQARLLEPLAMLWISLAYSKLGTNIAFKLMRR